VAGDEFNLGQVFEAVAGTIPEREAIVWGERRLTYAQVRDRSRRLASYLHAKGLGARSGRQGLAGHESAQDHLGLYLYNGNEYVEGMIASYLARVAPFNVNYRYVEEELRYLLTDSQARAIVYHATFAPVLAAVLPSLPQLTVLLQVADESGNDLLPGAVDYEEALASSVPEVPPVEPTPDDLYILYTGGTTGMPKGVLWRQHDIFRAAMGGRTYGTWELVESYEHLVARILPTGDIRVTLRQGIAIRRIGEPHAPIGMRDKVVRRVERLALILIRQHRHGPVRLPAHHPPEEVLARELPPLEIERIAVAMPRGRTERRDLATLPDVAELRVSLHVAEYDVLPLPRPGRPFRPGETRRQPMDCDKSEQILFEARVDDQDVGIRIDLWRRPVSPLPGRLCDHAGRRR